MWNQDAWLRIPAPFTSYLTLDKLFSLFISKMEMIIYPTPTPASGASLNQQSFLFPSMVSSCLLKLTLCHCLQGIQSNTDSFRKAGLLVGLLTRTQQRERLPRAHRKLYLLTTQAPSAHQHQGTLSHNPHPPSAAPLQPEEKRELRKRE